MKNVLLLFILTYSVTGFAQGKGPDSKLPYFQLNDSIYSWTLDPPLLTEWKYVYKYIDILHDADNNLIHETRQSWNGSAWENVYTYSYTYDANHNQTSSVELVWNGIGWNNSERITNTFDVNNNLLSKTYEN